MSYQHWHIDDLPWATLNPAAVDADLLRVMKAAALVEFNGEDYADYLCRVFVHDGDFQQAVRQWAREEVQHGAALGRWAQAVDPAWDFAAAVARFRAGYQPPLASDGSLRGSRSGELIARCIVETGTSSYYTALGEAAAEPVLRAICQKIAADELRHYKMFYDALKRYLRAESLDQLQRLRIGLGRIQESEDDELAYAYYAANAPAHETYRRERYTTEYMGRAYQFYRARHVERMVSMVLKACGIRPNAWWQRGLNALAWWLLNYKIRRARAALGHV